MIVNAIKINDNRTVRKQLKHNNKVSELRDDACLQDTKDRQFFLLYFVQVSLASIFQRVALKYFWEPKTSHSGLSVSCDEIVQPPTAGAQNGNLVKFFLLAIFFLSPLFVCFSIKRPFCNYWRPHSSTRHFTASTILISGRKWAIQFGIHGTNSKQWSHPFSLHCKVTTLQG